MERLAALPASMELFELVTMLASERVSLTHSHAGHQQHTESGEFEALHTLVIPELLDKGFLMYRRQEIKGVQVGQFMLK